MKKFLLGLGLGGLIGYAVKTIADSKKETDKLLKEGKKLNEEADRLIEVTECDISSFKPEFRKFAVDCYCKKNGMTLEDSIELARSVGVPEEDILKSMDDIDRFFTGTE